jgi:AcrR family transcriptional regulator
MAPASARPMAIPRNHSRPPGVAVVGRGLFRQNGRYPRPSTVGARVAMNTAASPATRWGDGRRADGDFAREQLVDAAWRCYQRSGVAKTTVEHVAREAKVSRTTVYRYFQNRDEVLTGVLVREIAVLLDVLRGRVDEVEGFGDYLVEAMAGIAELVPQSVVFQQMQQEENSVAARLCISSDDALAIAAGFIEQRFTLARQRGELREGIELPALVDWTVRILAAYMLTPAVLAGGAGDLRKTLRLFLLPAVVR